MKKILFTLGCVSLIGGAGRCTYNFYQEKQERIALEKETILKALIIQSPVLEQRAKFLDLKLGSDIHQYPGFKKWEFQLPSVEGEESWGYFGKDNQYASVGHFEVLNPIRELESAEMKFDQPKYKNSSRVALTVITYKKQIYKISAKIKEEGELVNETTRFNNFLRSVYGPCVTDNGHNEVDYNADEEKVWESKNVTLTTRGDTKIRYSYANGRSRYVGVDHFTTVEYVYKPVAEKVAALEAQQYGKVSTEGAAKL